MDLYFNDTGSGSSDWSNSSNWWDGPGGTGSSGYIPEPGVNLNLTIETSCTSGVPSNLDFNIALNAELAANNTTIPASRTITIGSGGNLNVAILLTISGTLNINAPWNSGALTVNTGGTVIVGEAWAAGSFTNDGTIVVGFLGALSLFSNSSNLSQGTILVNSTGQLSIEPNVTLVNDGILTLDSSTVNYISGTLTNNSNVVVGQTCDVAFRPSAVFTNNGTFTFGNAYSTKFKGRIFPQVPSSASWGNALL
jgi:hypothetical protein